MPGNPRKSYQKRLLGLGACLFLHSIIGRVPARRMPNTCRSEKRQQHSRRNRGGSASFPGGQSHLRVADRRIGRLATLFLHPWLFRARLIDSPRPRAESAGKRRPPLEFCSEWTWSFLTTTCSVLHRVGEAGYIFLIHKNQRFRIDAVAQPGWRRAVFEDVTQVAIAAG